MSGAPLSGGRARHHAWVKVKLHNYVCRKCGARKVNVEHGAGNWIAEWHLPNGVVVNRPLAPPCEPGQHTAERLVWLSEWQAGRAAAAGAEVSR